MLWATYLFSLSSRGRPGSRVTSWARCRSPVKPIVACSPVHAPCNQPSMFWTIVLARNVSCTCNQLSEGGGPFVGSHIATGSVAVHLLALRKRRTYHGRFVPRTAAGNKTAFFSHHRTARVIMVNNSHCTKITTQNRWGRPADCAF